MQFSRDTGKKFARTDGETQINNVVLIQVPFAFFVRTLALLLSSQAVSQDFRSLISLKKTIGDQEEVPTRASDS